MRNKQILACLTALAMLGGAAPVFAGDGSNPIIIFVSPSTTGSSVAWAPSSSIQPPNVCFDFTPTNNDFTASHYILSGGSYAYSYTPPTPPVRPDVPSFEAAIFNDGTLSMAVKLNLAVFFPLLESNVNNPSIIQAAWAGLIEVNGGTWLTSDVQTIVEGYATTYNVPLMP